MPLPAPLSSMKDLYLSQLIDLHNAETQILDALPRMAKLAPTPALQQAFATHYEQTVTHVERLESLIRPYDIQQRPSPNPGMTGIIDEGQHLTTLINDALTLELALIAAAQRVEHYEMAAYRTVRDLANQFGDQQAADLLETTLNEERETDLLLNQIAGQAVADQPELHSAQLGNTAAPLPRML